MPKPRFGPVPYPGLESSVRDTVLFRMASNRNDECCECLLSIQEGEQMIWDPESRKPYCPRCGELYADAQNARIVRGRGAE